MFQQKAINESGGDPQKPQVQGKGGHARRRKKDNRGRTSNSYKSKVGINKKINSFLLLSPITIYDYEVSWSYVACAIHSKFNS